MINFNKIYLLSEEESNSKKPEQKNPKRMTAAQKKAKEEEKRKKYEKRLEKNREYGASRREKEWEKRKDVRLSGQEPKKHGDIEIKANDPDYFKKYNIDRREAEWKKIEKERPIDEPSDLSLKDRKKFELKKRKKSELAKIADSNELGENNLIKLKYTDLLPSAEYEPLYHEFIKNYPQTNPSEFQDLFDRVFRVKNYALGEEHFLITKENYNNFLGDNGKLTKTEKEILKYEDLLKSYESIKIDNKKDSYIVLDPKNLVKIADIKAKNYEDALRKKELNNWEEYKVYNKDSINSMISNIENLIMNFKKKYEEQKKELKNILQPQYKMAYQMKHKNESQNSNVWFVTNEEGDVLKIIKSDNISEAESKFNDIVKTSKYNCHLINLSEVKTEIVAQTEDVVIATPDGTTRTMTPDQKVKAQKALQKEPIKIVKRGMPIQEDQVEEKFSSKLENLINVAVKKINELSESSEDKKYKKVLENVVKNLMNAQKALESVKSHESYVEEKKNIEDEKLAVKNVGSVRKQISKIVKDKEIVDRIMRKYNSDVAKKLQKKAPDADPEKLSKAIVKYFIKESKQQLDSILSEAESIEQVKKNCRH